MVDGSYGTQNSFSSFFISEGGNDSSIFLLMKFDKLPPSTPASGDSGIPTKKISIAAESIPETPQIA